MTTSPMAAARARPQADPHPAQAPAHRLASEPEVGQGARTVFAQIVCRRARRFSDRVRVRARTHG